ncbi:growth factor receptor bound protein 2-associated protein 1, isoform CRA_a [Mus musculus]|nr:growth factor receptor bound protein 2-associated protein 1, isoform CRA_a [Mus musculus]
MSGGEVVCSGWLRKSPPEKKLKRYAWKRRWFVLRSGRLTGDPDVLEYYKNDHAKKPIRIIDLNLCQQVDAGLTFNKKEFENSYIFDINTIDRIFYLVADSEEDMNKWVRCICDICGFNPTEEDASSQDCYDIPRTFPSDRSSSLEGFHSQYKIKSVLTAGGVSGEELDENYVPMNPNSPPRQHSGSFTEPIQEPNYVPMTPGTFDFSSFGMQVPPPAHMGFRSSPKTPPRRPVPVADCEPPPVDRNLKPDRKVKPAPLDIKPLSEWEELQAPVRSPITRSFAREFPMSPRPDSVHSTTSSSDSHDSEENYVPMNPNLSGEDPNLFASNSLDGGSSPMNKPKGDKQVEYLDLDLDSGKSTPPRKQKSSGSGSSMADERVDYVVVDQQKTLALKSTREAWTDGRQSTESETPTKNVK